MSVISKYIAHMGSKLNFIKISLSAESARSLFSTMPLAVVLFAGCGGGAGTETNQSSSSGGTSNAIYNGPDPESNNPLILADIEAYKMNVWQFLKESNRCGSCHDENGTAPTPFVREDNIQLAYEALRLGGSDPLVDKSNAENSKIVTKVAGGHNCYNGSTPQDLAACKDDLTSMIEAWVGLPSGSGGRQIQLSTPGTLVMPSVSKTWPGSAPAGYTGVHTLLTNFCSGCHVESSATPQAPFFANSDMALSYDAVKTSGKIDLTSPANSRLVIRLRDEFHNCWDTGSGIDCPGSATAMQTAIETFVNAIPAPSGSELASLTTSLGMRMLEDGIVASGGNRYENDQIALYEFKAGSGDQIIDTSGKAGVGLTIAGIEDLDYRWVGGWGVEFISNNARAQASTTDSKFLYDSITLTGQYSLEAWVVPYNVTQEMANIVGYSGGPNDLTRNFTLGQRLYNYEFYNNSSTNTNGAPLATADADEDLQATLQHVVATYDPVEGRKIYVNGVFTDDVDPLTIGTLTTWSDTYAFTMGNEVSLDRAFRGTLKLVAVHDRALTQAQIQQNFDLGVGQKLYLLFSLTDMVGSSTVPLQGVSPCSYILFEVSQFDNYGYLFNTPTYVVLNDTEDPSCPATATPSSIQIKGMYIGINGKIAPVGQAYRNIDVTANNGQLLSSLGTIIALENGPSPDVASGLLPDQFFLAFEQIGTDGNAIPDAPPSGTTYPTPAEVSDIGVRIFAEINATMSEVTGISTTNGAVVAQFQTYKQQFPTVETIEGFLSSHQMAIAQLSMTYCDVLVNTTPGYFTNANGSFDFSASSNTAFDSANKRDRIIDPMLAAMVNVDLLNAANNLQTQPTEASMRTEIEDLIDRFTNCGNARSVPNCSVNSTARTAQVVKAACAAFVGNAADLIQ